MDNRKGFTIVEIVVVIAVLAILVTLATIGVDRYLTDAHDSERHSKVSVISSALEKYYQTNGEYPGCTALTASGATVATATLKGIDTTALIAPGAASGTTNSIRCGETLAVNTGDDFYQFVGDGSGACSTTGPCGSFTIRYRNETMNTILEMRSLN